MNAKTKPGHANLGEPWRVLIIFSIRISKYLRPISCLNEAIVHAAVAAYSPSRISTSGPSVPIKHSDAKGRFVNTGDLWMPVHEGLQSAVKSQFSHFFK
jgi:hypothetical protein